MSSRLMIGGIAAAAVIAGTTSAVALAGPSSTPSPKPLATPRSTVDPNLSRVAAQLGISVNRLLQALPRAKMAAASGGSLSDDAAARAMAEDLGVTAAQARRALQELSGAAAAPGTKPAAPPSRGEALSALAARLNVSTARAGQVLDALDRMGSPGHGVDPASPAFAALARSLGKTPAQLTQILGAWKQGLRSTLGQSPAPRPGVPSPTKS
jgi:hypothetical protein